MWNSGWWDIVFKSVVVVLLVIIGYFSYEIEYIQYAQAEFIGELAKIFSDTALDQKTF